jgi:cell wall-associated NlpC family hydrolase
MKRVIWIYFSVILVLALSYLAVHFFYKGENIGAPLSSNITSVYDSVLTAKVSGSIIPHSPTRADSIITFAKQLLGTEYKYGSCTPGGFDCSGFVFYVFSSFGITLPRSSITMGEIGTDIPLENADRGDLIFFTGTAEDDPDIGHVGIVITSKGQPLEFIHSSSATKESGVKISTLTSKYKQRFVRVKRVF